ncbi:hypothetical protein ACHAXS_010903 [Conticribra weissflogii]
MSSQRNIPRSQPSGHRRDSHRHGRDYDQDNDGEPYRYYPHPHDLSIGHDSSTAMSLDESSIHPINASISSTPAAYSRAIWPASGSARKLSRVAAAAASSPVFSPTSDGGASMDLSSTPTISSSSRMPAGPKMPTRMRDVRLFSSSNLRNESTSVPDELNGKEPTSATQRNGNDMPSKRPPNQLNLNPNSPIRKNDVDKIASNQSIGTNTTNFTSNQSREWNFSTIWNIEQARIQLRRASKECRRRGLTLASRWASEQLMGLAPQRSSRSQRNDDNHDSNQSQSEKLFVEETCEPNDVEIYALSLFDLGEYRRTAYALSTGTGHISLNTASHFNSSSHPAQAASRTEITNDSFAQIHPPRRDLTPLGRYIRAYSLYLEGERKKEEQVTELRDPLERTSVQNAHLPTLEAELRRMSVRGELDAFGLYIYGVVLKELRGTKRSPGKKRTAASLGVSGSDDSGDTAQAILIRSILMYPYNWSAWLDLAELCSEDPLIDREVEQSLSSISGHWMYHFFCVHVFIENRANENAIAIIEKLANGNQNSTAAAAIGESDEAAHFDDVNAVGFFIQSAYLQSQLAMAYYDVRDYDSAHEHFLALAEREPYRLDHMDAFSNVLYVKDQKVALSHLAHRSIAIDKYRPETCIIVGNYYSSKARHEKAVQYFQRALKLDRTYLSAWTLLGHEYIEMKNTAAAIEAYRRAVDISEREYRAWYAAALHPNDSRMWCAIGGCLLGLDRRNDAEKSYERAVSLGDGEGIATRKLAELYQEDGEEEKAAKCFLRHLELRYQAQETGVVGNNASSSPEAFETVIRNVRIDEPEAEALLYLANYYRDNLEYDAAILCATRLEDYPGPEKEQGKGLLRDIRLRMDQKAGERRYGGLQSPVTPAVGSLLARRGRGGFNLSMESSPHAASAESSFEFSP